MKKLNNIFSSNPAECITQFNNHLNYLNEQTKHTIDGHVSSAIGAIMGHISYERVALHGPRKGAVTEESPLITP